MASPAPAPIPEASHAWSRLWLMVLSYAAIVLACLRIPGSPHPWSRLDPFSGGYLALSLALFAEQALFAARFRPAPEIRRLFYSLDIDAGFERWTVGLGLAELAAFLDYAHWHPPDTMRGALPAGAFRLWLRPVRRGESAGHSAFPVSRTAAARAPMRRCRRDSAARPNIRRPSGPCTLDDREERCSRSSAQSPHGMERLCQLHGLGVSSLWRG